MKIRKSTSGTYLLVLFFFVSTINFLDKQILSIVQEDVKLDLSLSDSQLGFLALAFGLVHAICALPIGRMADRIPRKGVLVFCLTMWSGMTALGGFAANYMQLMLTRIGVAAGEAGVTPTTYSIISDKFKAEKRATALAVVGAGIPVGIMMSLLAGGLIADAYGWRMTFIIFGVPGLIVAFLLAFTVQAPEKGESDGVKKVRETSFKLAFRHLMATPTFLFVLVGAAVKGAAAQGIAQWMPTFYIRRFDLSMSEVGLSLGLLFGICGVIGLFAASFLADRLSKRDMRWYPWIVAWSNFAVVPFIIGALLVDDYTLSLALFAVSLLSGNAMLAITNALVQGTAPVQMRGMASAMKTTMLSFVGFGIGGALTGILSDVFDDGTAYGGLMISLAIMSTLHIGATIAFQLSARTLLRDMEKARRDSEDVSPEVSVSAQAKPA